MACGVLLILLAVFLDVWREKHHTALIAGFFGSGLTVFAVSCHIILPRRRN